MRKQGVKKIVFSSSACVYGSPEKLPLTEDSPVHPDNPYGASKASVESFLQSYYVNFGMDAIVLRYFNPYGPGEAHDPETHAIPNFIKSTLSKNPITLYWKGEQIRDFIYIDDLAQAHIDVLNLSGYHIFNVGTEKGVKVKDVVDKIFKIVGYTVAVKDLGKRPGDVNANYASSKKLHSAVGWQAKVNLEEGLRRTIEDFKTHKK
jgi:UDP-glucose 4-epimerase